MFCGSCRGDGGCGGGGGGCVVVVVVIVVVLLLLLLTLEFAAPGNSSFFGQVMIHCTVYIFHTCPNL